MSGAPHVFLKHQQPLRFSRLVVLLSVPSKRQLRLICTRMTPRTSASPRARNLHHADMPLWTLCPTPSARLSLVLSLLSLLSLARAHQPDLARYALHSCGTPSPTRGELRGKGMPGKGEYAPGMRRSSAHTSATDPCLGTRPADALHRRPRAVPAQDQPLPRAYVAQFTTCLTEVESCPGIWTNDSINWTQTLEGLECFYSTHGSWAIGAINLQCSARQIKQTVCEHCVYALLDCPNPCSA